MNSDIVREYWRRLGAQDWDGMAELLGPEVKARYPATREQFDKASFVRLNAEYPGHWDAEILDLVGIDDRVVTLARVCSKDEAHLVSSWFTLAEGRVTELDELWAEEGTVAPTERRP